MLFGAFLLGSGRIRTGRWRAGRGCLPEGGGRLQPLVSSPREAQGLSLSQSGGPVLGVDRRVQGQPGNPSSQDQELFPGLVATQRALPSADREAHSLCCENKKYPVGANTDTYMCTCVRAHTHTYAKMCGPRAPVQGQKCTEPTITLRGEIVKCPGEVSWDP